MQRRYADSPGVWLIIAASAAVYLVDILYQGNLAAWGAKSAAIWAGQWYRLFTATFLHGGLLHIFFNMYALYLFGQMTENVLGSGRFGVLYLLSGAVGYIVSLLLAPDMLAVGASASIFGLIGFALQYRLRHLPRIWSPIDRAFTQILGINLMMAFIVPNIDHWAHLGGLLGGMVLGVMFAISPGPQSESGSPQPQRIVATVVFAAVMVFGMRPLLLASVAKPLVPSVATSLHAKYDRFFQPYRMEYPAVLWLYADEMGDWDAMPRIWYPNPDRPAALAFFWRWQRGGGRLEPGILPTYVVQWYRDGEPVHRTVDVITGVDNDVNLLVRHGPLPVTFGRDLAGQWTVTVSIDNVTLAESSFRIMPRR